MIKPTEKLKVFVYGSLREGFFNYDKYLKGKVSCCEQARTEGKLYHMPHKGYPALLDGTDTIYGELMTIEDFETVMVAMDTMEGYFGENHKDNEYNREIREIFNISSGKMERAYIYKYALNDADIFSNNSHYISDGCWKTYMLNK